MSQDTGICGACDAEFSYRLVHDGFSETNHAYCSRCYRTAFLHHYCWPNAAPRPQAGSPLNAHYGPIDLNIEPWLKPCVCGGKFAAKEKPKCPDCCHELDAAAAAQWIERQAPGSKSGFRWNKTWASYYAIVINDGAVADPWLDD